MITVFYHHITEAMRQTQKTFEEIAAECRVHGITGLEMDYNVLRQEGTALAERCSAAGLPIVSAYCFFDWGNKNPLSLFKRLGCRLKRTVVQTPEEEGIEALLRLKDAGIHNMLVVPGFVPANATVEVRKQYKDSMIAAVRVLVKNAGTMGIQVNMEDFDDETAVYAKASDLEDFLRSVPELGCAFDTGNFLYSEEDALKVLPELLPEIRYVHCKDREWKPLQGIENPEYKETVSGRKMYAAPVGGGIIPMKEILKILQEFGYDGPIAIEHFGAADYLQTMLQSADWLLEKWRQI